MIPNSRKIASLSCHHGYFSLDEGRRLLGRAPPAARITLEVRGEDVYATGVELRTT